MSWNPVLNFVLGVKNEYIKQFELITYSYKSGYTNNSESCLERWIRQLLELDENNEQYRTWQDMIDPLEINQHNNFILVRYGQYSNIYSGEVENSGEDFWDRYDGFYRECRSVVIDVENDCLALTPYKKFWNINELPETNIDIVREKIANARTVEFSDKLDGSMQSARWYNGEILMAGSQALDLENSWRLTDGYRMIKATSNYECMLKDFPELTFIFEYISLKDAHVVKYTKEQEGLYLIGVRHVTSGHEFGYKQIIDFANAYNIPTTKVFDKTLDQVMSELDDKSSDEAEGFVLNVDNKRFKIKYNDYCAIHKALSKLSSINLIIRMIADGKYDDLLSKLPEAYHTRVQKVANFVFGYTKETENQIADWYKKAPKDDKKTFMVWVNENVPKELKGYVRKTYENQEFSVIKKGIKEPFHYKKLNEMGVTNYKELFEDE